MSRAFMKERDDLPTPEIVQQASDPRPMTAAGLRALRERIELTPPGTERDELARIADSALAVPPPADRRVIALGATVTVEGPAGSLQTVTIVGEDEIDVVRGKVGADSPLAQALLGKRAGQDATWKRPAGDRKLRIRSVIYSDTVPPA